MVITLAKPIGLACSVYSMSRAFVDGCLWLPSTSNAAPPAPYLASLLSLPYFKYISIWIYGVCSAICPGCFSGGLSHHCPRMVIYTSRQIKVSLFRTKTKWTLVSSLAMLVSWAYHSNSLANSDITITAWHTFATPICRLNSLHWIPTCLTT